MATSLGANSPDGYKLIAHAAQPFWSDYNPKKKRDTDPEPAEIVNSHSKFRLIAANGDRIETTAEEHDQVVDDRLNDVIAVWAC